jgi:hypothetical protein
MQGLQPMQVVAMDNEVAVQNRLANALVGIRQQRTEGHGQMVIVDEFFALKIQFRHSLLLSPYASAHLHGTGVPVRRPELIKTRQLI